ncbi:FecR domain-containing protein [Neolewinella lacunae]|uniref:FecR domain-containing protein n=1 Tax=Neolewinella lacunae TaxID=1517758 RepID=A0A923TAG3_9BACT|nr:FecR domain-containing protein [Neolewinella lacunae]MBC6996148.1 FecR domain-containing protein [Neolewinella lacunae]MDN3634000.1 FecR domain-containing protein [Neolewinella lacunae]
MPHIYTRFLSLDCEQLLEDPDFRQRALSVDASVRAHWTAWLDEHPAYRPTAEMARAILLAVDAPSPVTLPSPREKATDFAALLSRAQVAKERPLRRSRMLPFAAAAGLLLLIVAVFLLRPTAPTVYASNYGELREIVLPDGTVVNLNANSTLTIPTGGWTAEARTVLLDGEAFFAVKPQPAGDDLQPFVVRTRAAEVRVYGTRFNVRDRRGKTQVFLEEGAVSVGWAQGGLPETPLLPGEVLDLTAGAGTAERQKAEEPAALVAWKTGRLVFSERPLAEALESLGDLYGVVLTCPDDAVAQRVISSAGIPVDDLELALQLLEKALNLKVERVENSKVYLVHSAE